MNIELAILRAASFFVPNHQRAGWLAEWRSELWYVAEDRNAFCLGAFRDALWVLRNAGAPEPRRPILESPWICILALTTLAVPAAFFGAPLLAHRPMLVGNFLMMIMALLVLPTTTSIELGEYPRTKPLRRWIFLAVKFVLVIPIVFFGTFQLVSLLSTEPVHGHVTLVSYVLAFRWILTDQRRRCPVCLRLVVKPVRIGCSSRTFLEWYGAEFVCLKGHGTLQVPEITSNYTTQRWQYFDPSWSSLFR